MEKLYEASEVSYDSTPEFFNLYWDNDVVTLTVKDASILITLLEEFINA